MSNEASSSGRRWRRVAAGAVGALLLVAGAIALGVVYSGKQGGGAAVSSQGDSTVGGDVSKVLDALKGLVGADGGDATPAADGTTTTTTTVTPVPPAIVTTDANKDGQFSSEAAKEAGSAPVPGPQGLLQGLAAGALSSLGLKVCTPADGPELESMVMGTACSVILLTQPNSNPYVVTQIMPVTSNKIIIGHPIDIPVIKSVKGVERLFDVHAPATLDMRFVYMIRPGGRALNDGRLRLIVGGMVFVRLGATFRGAGLVFTDPPQTWESFYKELTSPQNSKRTFGGYVAVVGGAFFCHGCQIFRNYPYGLPIVNVFQIGRDFLVVAGVQVCTGCYHAAWVPYISTVNIGNAVAVLGGVCIRIGGGIIGAGVVTGQWGAGQGLFVGGGVLVDVGHQIQNTFVGLARGGMGMQSVGAGVYVLIAELENRAWAVASIFGAGQVYAVGSGILDKTGGEVANCQVSAVQALVGGSSYLGSGSMSIVGESFARVGVTLSQHGAGMTWFNGAGQMDLIYVPSFVTQVVRVQFILGAEIFLGAGHYTNVNNTRWTYQVVNAAMPGYEGWVGPGSAVFIRSRTYSARVVNYRLRPFLWVVAGRGVSGGLYSNNNLLVNKDGVTVLKPQPTPKPKLARSKARLLQELAEATAQAKRNLALFGNAPAALTVVQSEAETRRIRPPRAQELTRRLTSAVSDLHASRRLQGLPATTGLGLFGGLNAEKLMEAWQSVMESEKPFENKYKDTVIGADGIERWPEYVYAGGNDTKCFICGMGPGTTAEHINPDGSMVPFPYEHGENTPAVCSTSDACAPGNAPQDIGGLMATAQAEASQRMGGPLELPHGLKTHARSRYARRLLRILQADNQQGLATALPDHNILTYEVVAHCAQGQDDEACALAQTDLKSAFEQYLFKNAGEDSAFKVAASSSAVPAAVTKVLGDLDTDGFLDNVAEVASSGGCGKGFKFTVYATAPDVDSTKEVAGLLEAASKDPTQVLDEIQSSTGQQLCGLTMTPKKALYFPALSKPGAQSFYQGLYTGKGAFAPPVFFPDVTVVSPSMPAPVTDAVAGRTYKILLEGFMAMGPVVVELVQGTRTEGDKIAEVPGEMKQGEVVEVEFVAPEPEEDLESTLQGDGETRAYIRAFYSAPGLKGLYAQSEVFTLESAAGVSA